MRKARKPRGNVQKISGIYAIVNFSQRKFYVGSSVDVRTRILSHRDSLKHGTHHCKRLQDDWDALGEECFHEVLIEGEVSIKDMHDRENFWMDVLGSRSHYNAVRAARRTDFGFYRLKHMSVRNGQISVGQGVMYMGRQDEVASITKKHNRYTVFLDRNGYVDQNLIYPMDCD